MNRILKSPLLLGLCLVAAGSIIILVGMTWVGFDIQELNTVSYERRSVAVSDRFESISVNTLSHNIRLLPSEDNSCRVDYDESSLSKFTVAVEDGVLKVREKDTSKWYDHIGLFWNVSPQVILHVPVKQYKELTAKSAAGNILVDEAFSFNRAEVQATSGDLSFLGSAGEELSLKTTSGDIHFTNTMRKNNSLPGNGITTVSSTSGEIVLETVSVEALSVESTSGDIQLYRVDTVYIDRFALHPVYGMAMSVQAISGDVLLDSVSAESLSVGTVSGEITLKRTHIDSEAEISTTSGDVKLDYADMGPCSFDIRTASGSVSGQLQAGHRFAWETTSGDIDLPSGKDSGSSFYIKTVSGDVKLSAAD